MRWIVSWMKGILLISGALTCTMFYAAVDPDAALRSTFGDTVEGPIAEIVVRNWGVLIGLMGLMLLYAAFDVAARPLVLTVAGTSKLVFIGLILVAGRPFLAHQAGVAVVCDLIQVALFAAYLIAAPRAGRASALADAGH